MHHLVPERPGYALCFGITTQPPRSGHRMRLRVVPNEEGVHADQRVGPEPLRREALRR